MINFSLFVSALDLVEAVTRDSLDLVIVGAVTRDSLDLFPDSGSAGAVTGGLSDLEETLFIFDRDIKDSSKSSGAASIRLKSFGGSSFFFIAEMLVNVGEQI